MTAAAVGGPLHVGEMHERHVLCDAFFDAAEAAGYPRNKDYNSGIQDGFNYFQVTIKNGKRWAGGARLPRPGSGRGPTPDRDRGADRQGSARGQAGGRRCLYRARLVCEARAAREVIVSGGAVQSPGVLERSAIGQPELLRQYASR